MTARLLFRGSPRCRRRAFGSQRSRDQADPDDAVGQSEIDAVLAENGVTIPRVHPDRRRLVLALLRAGMEAHRDVLARLDGKPVQTPIPVEPLRLPDPDEGSKLRDAYKAWKAQRKPAGKTAEEYCVYVERFIAINGNLG